MPTWAFVFTYLCDYVPMCFIGYVSYVVHVPSVLSSLVFSLFIYFHNIVKMHLNENWKKKVNAHKVKASVI